MLPMRLVNSTRALTLLLTPDVVQTILLTIGYLHRHHATSLKQDPASFLTMTAVSNRLASSVSRTRTLGIIIGVGIYRCVDQPGKVTDLHFDDVETEMKDISETIFSIKPLARSTSPS